MVGKILIFVIGIASKQDSTPPLHTLPVKDIESIVPDDYDRLAIKLKGGATYLYEHKDWDYEDVHFSLDSRIKEAIRMMQKTFTRVEHPPEFPGGDVALSEYMYQFCNQHSKQLKDKIPVEVTVQFIVHLHGEVRDVQIVRGGGDPTIDKLAIQAINDGPAWIPATQNGRIVLSYKMQKIILNL
jgi:TonB family protein